MKNRNRNKHSNKIVEQTGKNVAPEESNFLEFPFLIQTVAPKKSVSLSVNNVYMRRTISIFVYLLIYKWLYLYICARRISTVCVQNVQRAKLRLRVMNLIVSWISVTFRTNSMSISKLNGEWVVLTTGSYPRKSISLSMRYGETIRKGLNKQKKKRKINTLLSEIHPAAKL